MTDRELAREMLKAVRNFRERSRTETDPVMRRVWLDNAKSMLRGAAWRIHGHTF